MAPIARGIRAFSSSRTSGCSSSFSTTASTTGRTMSRATYSATVSASRHRMPRKTVFGSCGSGISGKWPLPLRPWAGSRGMGWSCGDGGGAAISASPASAAAALTRSTGRRSASNHGLRFSQPVLRQLGWGRGMKSGR